MSVSTELRTNTFRANMWRFSARNLVCSTEIKRRNRIENGELKPTLLQALRLCTGRTAHRGSGGIALLFFGHGTRRSEESATRPRRSLPPGKTRYPLYRRLGGPQGRSGQLRRISPPPGFDSRTVQPVTSRYTAYATRPWNRM
jgi:hypothetical protein